MFEIVEGNSEKITGRIALKISPGWWIIEDEDGRRHRVSSMSEYKTGVGVVAVSGQIVGTAGVRTAQEIHQV